MKRHNTLLVTLLFLAACSAAPESADKAAAPQAQPQPAASAAAPAPTEVREPARKPAARPAEPKPERAPKQVSMPAPAPQPVASAQPVPLPAPPTAAPQPDVAAATPVPVPPPPPEPKRVTIPAGTQITVRMIDSIDSDTGHVGQAYKASMDNDLKVDSDTVIPRGSDVFVKLVDVQSAGKMTGKSEVKVQLDRLVVGRNSYPVQSNVYVQEAKSQTAKTAKTVGVGSAIGAIIGGIAGGRKGAVIGAGAGAGGGAAVEAAQKSEQVHIDSETALVFRLESPLDVTVTPGTATPSKNRFVPVP